MLEQTTIAAGRRPLSAGAYDLDGVDVSFAATSDEVMNAIARILRGTPRPLVDVSKCLEVFASLDSSGWQIEIDGKVRRELSHRSPAGAVAWEMLEAASAQVARVRGSTVLSGPVLVRGNRAVAIVGGNQDSAKTLGLHLHARGWAAVTFALSFLRNTSLEVIAMPSLTTIRSSVIDQIPPKYRLATESSLWYDAGHDLIFYTVDPLLVKRDAAASTLLTHLLVVSGASEDRETSIRHTKTAEVLEFRNHSLAHCLKSATVSIGAMVPMTSAVEAWLLK